MDYGQTTRWFLKRLHQNEHKIINIGAEIDISRSLRSVIPLNRVSFQHISKRHCAITCRNGVATLTDETSSTGTFVNDRKLGREQPGSVILSEGDRIGVGTPCDQSQVFYEANSHVLLFEVCKDRNRAIPDCEVNTISDDDHENVEPQNQQQVPQLEGTQGTEKPYRILQNIDLLSDDDEIKFSSCDSRAAPFAAGSSVESVRIAEKDKINREEVAQKEADRKSKEEEAKRAADRRKTESDKKQKEEELKKDSERRLKEAEIKRREEEARSTAERTHKEAERKETENTIRETERKQQEDERKKGDDRNQQETERNLKEVNIRREADAIRQENERKLKETETKRKVNRKQKEDNVKRELKLKPTYEEVAKESEQKRKEELAKEKVQKRLTQEVCKITEEKKLLKASSDNVQRSEVDKMRHRNDEAVKRLDHQKHSLKESDEHRRQRKEKERTKYSKSKSRDREKSNEHKNRDGKDTRSKSSSSKDSDRKHDRHRDREDKKHHRHRSRKKSTEKDKHKKSSTRDEKPRVEVKQDERDEKELVVEIDDKPDEIEVLFRDSVILSPDIPIILIEDSDEIDDENDFSEKRLTQSFYRQIKKEAEEVDTQIDEPEPVEIEDLPKIEIESIAVSEDTPLFNSDDDDEDEEDMETSRRWFMRLSQRNSPVKIKPQQASTRLKRKYSELDNRGSIPIPHIEEQNDRPHVEMEEWFGATSDESKLKDDPLCTEIAFRSPEVKRMKSSDAVSAETSSGIAVAAGLRQTTSDAVRVGTSERNTNSASNAWISRKVAIVQPHFIQKRRKSTITAPSVKKPPKPVTSKQKISKHATYIQSKECPPPPSRKPANSKEAIKQKLKEISAKKAQINDANDKSSKPFTIPKVKFTPSNRGAFLSGENPALPKPKKPVSSSVPTNDGFDDFICTQSTSLENVPMPEYNFEIPVAKAPKLTFDSVAKVSSVTRDVPVFKIPKRRLSVAQKQTASHDFNAILEGIEAQIKPVTRALQDKTLEEPIVTPSVAINSSKIKSILKPPMGLSRKAMKQVKWKESLVETRTFEIDDGNYMLVQAKYSKDNKAYFRDMSLASCQNDIIQEITSWNADWFDNPSEATISGEKLLPMVEEYKDFEDYKRIVLPILKTELFHDILGQYAEVKKSAQKPIQMKVNQVRSQTQSFVLNCSVESNTNQSISNKDYVLIFFTDKSNGKELRVPAVVVTRRQQIQHAGDNFKFYHCTIETAKSLISYRIRDGFGEKFHILSLTQINLHMRQFHVLFNLQSSPLLDNILSPRSNFYSTNNDVDRRTYKGKICTDWHRRFPHEYDLLTLHIKTESLNVQQGDTLLSVFGQCLDMTRPHIMLVQGPPGTGKSRLISNLVLQLHRGIPSDRRLKILVCAQSNTAVDVIVLKLIKLFRLLNKNEQSNMLRTGTSNKVNQDCRMVFLDDLARKHVNEQIKCRKLRAEDPVFETYYLEKDSLERRIKHLQIQCNNVEGLPPSVRSQDDIKQLQNQLNQVKRLLPQNIDDMDLYDKDRRSLEMCIKKQLVSKADIICTTLGSCGSLLDYSQSLKFDVCIIDEATQCTEIASFTPLQYDVKKLILVGDVNQLPPLVFGKECAEAGLKNSLFSRIQNSFAGTNLEGVKMLTTQYRMHPEILKWPNDFFYEGKLSSDTELTKCDEFPFKPYTIFSLEYQQNLTQMEHQIYNDDEIQFVIKLLNEIIQYCERHTSIAIITPYARHKRECEKYLYKKKITQVSVLSIDSVQGQEYDVVIISLARSIGTGFLDSPQRLNVALTRARKCLIMCGNFSDLRETNVWSALLKDAEDRKLLYHIDDDADYDDVNTFVEKVMGHLRKTPNDEGEALNKNAVIVT